jgi:hypothetical protein
LQRSNNAQRLLTIRNMGYIIELVHAYDLMLCKWYLLALVCYQRSCCMLLLLLLPELLTLP